MEGGRVTITKKLGGVTLSLLAMAFSEHAQRREHPARHCTGYSRLIWCVFACVCISMLQHVPFRVFSQQFSIFFSWFAVRGCEQLMEVGDVR